MNMFWEFFTFELKFRFKSVSTYVYFALWFAFNFLNVASENFGPIGSSNGKVMLNGPYANIYNDIGVAFFGVIIIAAIFGTSILRDFQRDTIQILFTKPISKFAYLGGRWAGSFVTTVFAFSYSASSAAPSHPGPTMPASARTVSIGTCSRSSPSSSGRYSSSGRCFSWLPPSPAGSSSSICRARSSSCCI